MTIRSELALIFKWSVIRRATIIALIVGQVLALINHGDRILAATMTPVDWFKVTLTFFVPYTVSTISSVLALREQAALFERWQQSDQISTGQRLRAVSSEPR